MNLELVHGDRLIAGLGAFGGSSVQLALSAPVQNVMTTTPIGFFMDPSSVPPRGVSLLVTGVTRQGRWRRGRGAHFSILHTFAVSLPRIQPSPPEPLFDMSMRKVTCFSEKLSTWTSFLSIVTDAHGAKPCGPESSL